MIQKKISLIILILVSIMVILAIALIIFFYQNRNNKALYYPSPPTQAERDAAKKLPIEKCSCWDADKNICLPQADCL